MRMADKRGKKPACFGSIGEKKTSEKESYCMTACEWRILCRREKEGKQKKK